MNTVNNQIELNIEALHQVSGGCGRRHGHNVHQAGNFESPQQLGQQPLSVADLSVIIAGARIKF